MINPSPSDYRLSNKASSTKSFYPQTNQIGGHLAGTLGRKTDGAVSQRSERTPDGIVVAVGSASVALGGSVRYSESELVYLRRLIV